MSQYIHTTDIHNTKAAAIILPLVFRQTPVKSVLDVGCGLGTWLAVSEQLGVTDIAGIDGPGLDQKMLAVPAQKITLLDLTKSFSLNRTFDLAICLEVGEHLPAVAADTLVDSLVRHADTILFSAAIPGQGGQHHLNEQWPAYWQEKFARHGYFFEDTIRPAIWDHTGVEWWYRQNIFLVKKGGRNDAGRSLAMIHPELHELRLKNEKELAENLSVGKQGIVLGLKIFWNSILYKIKTLFGGG